MNLVQWSKSSVGYGRKLLHSATEGARNGEEEFLNHEPLAPFLEDSAHEALRPAALGACLGAFYACLTDRHKSASKILACTFVGGVVGFGAGLLWESRHLTASIASTVSKNIQQTRDEHWFEKNPIDYA